MEEQHGNRVWAWVGGAFALFLGLVVCLWALLWRVVPDDPAEVQRIRDATIKRIEQANATPSSRNGYDVLAPALLYGAPAGLTQPYSILGPYTERTHADIVTNLKQSPAKSRADLAQAARVLPDIRKALARPEFVPPTNWRQGFNGKVPNYIVLRGVAQTLTVLGVDRELEGRPAEALDLYLSALELGSRLQKNGTLIGLMISVAIQAIPMDSLFHLLGSEALDAGAARHALTRLRALPGRRDDMLNAMDQEFVLALVTLDDAVRNPQVLTGVTGVPSNALVGLVMPRERTLFENQHLRMRPALRALDVDQVAALMPSGSPSGLQGIRSYSFLVAILTPNSTRALAQFKAIQAQVAAATVMAALRLYRLEHGAYPDALQALVPGYLKQVPLADTPPDAPFEYRRSGRSYYLAAASPVFPMVGKSSPLIFHQP